MDDPMQISEAYEVLSNEELRAYYDTTYDEEQNKASRRYSQEKSQTSTATSSQNRPSTYQRRDATFELNQKRKLIKEQREELDALMKKRRDTQKRLDQQREHLKRLTKDELDYEQKEAHRRLGFWKHLFGEDKEIVAARERRRDMFHESRLLLEAHVGKLDEDVKKLNHQVREMDDAVRAVEDALLSKHQRYTESYLPSDLNGPFQSMLREAERQEAKKQAYLDRQELAQREKEEKKRRKEEERARVKAGEEARIKKEEEEFLQQEHDRYFLMKEARDRILNRYGERMERMKRLRLPSNPEECNELPDPGAKGRASQLKRAAEDSAAATQGDPKRRRQGYKDYIKCHHRNKMMRDWHWWIKRPNGHECEECYVSPEAL